MTTAKAWRAFNHAAIEIGCAFQGGTLTAIILSFGIH